MNFSVIATIKANIASRPKTEISLGLSDQSAIMAASKKKAQTAAQKATPRCRRFRILGSWAPPMQEASVAAFGRIRSPMQCLCQRRIANGTRREVVRRHGWLAVHSC
jgi:hypothetical protein